MHKPGPVSQKLWSASLGVIPGGVNSPVRAFGAVGGDPLFVRRASGASIYDVDDRAYIDYVMSWGPMILGHAAPRVVAAAQEACGSGMSFGIPTEAELRLAERIVECIPSVESVRMVNSGTEAAMSAMRLARGATGRDLVVKFEGCYHGHSDPLLAAAGSGVATFAVPDTAGVPASFTEKTIVLPYNDTGAAREAFSTLGDQVACAIVEPVGGNMGVVPPEPGFLETLRELTREHGALLIFDEVITGFRLGLAGAQGLYGVTPDLTVLGKIVGGGMPCAAYAGPRAIMEHLAPVGPVYQAGTLSGNPVAMSAGLATVETLMEDPPYARLDRLALQLAAGLRDAAAAAGVPVWQNRVGSMQTLFFTEGPVTDFRSAKSSDTARYGRWFHGMLARGVYFAPSQFEAAFVSVAHTEELVAKTVSAAKAVLQDLE
jgi:glutamate-1-semialdehyde 2,1-aminomutase